MARPCRLSFPAVSFGLQVYDDATATQPTRSAKRENINSPIFPSPSFLYIVFNGTSGFYPTNRKGQTSVCPSSFYLYLIIS